VTSKRSTTLVLGLTIVAACATPETPAGQQLEDDARATADLDAATGCPEAFVSENYAGQCTFVPTLNPDKTPVHIGICLSNSSCCRELRPGDDLNGSILSNDDVRDLHRSCVKKYANGQDPGDCYESSGVAGCAGGWLCSYCYQDFCLDGGYQDPCDPPPPDE